MRADAPDRRGRRVCRSQNVAQPHLRGRARLQAQGAAAQGAGTMLASTGRDGPHDARIVPIDGPGEARWTYVLVLRCSSSGSRNRAVRHADDGVGIAAWWQPFGVSWTLAYPVDQREIAEAGTRAGNGGGRRRSRAPHGSPDGKRPGWTPGRFPKPLGLTGCYRVIAAPAAASAATAPVARPTVRRPALRTGMSGRRFSGPPPVPPARSRPAIRCPTPGRFGPLPAARWRCCRTPLRFPSRPLARCD